MNDDNFNSFLDPIARVWGNSPVFLMEDHANQSMKKPAKKIADKKSLKKTGYDDGRS